MYDSWWDDSTYKKNFFLNFEKGYIYGRRDLSIPRPPVQIERLGYPPQSFANTNQNQKMKLFNVIFILGAIVLTWLTEAKQEDKIFLTIFFSLAIGFWLMAMSGEEKQKRIG